MKRIKEKILYILLMSTNKKIGVALGVLLSALCVPLVCLVSACVRTHKEAKAKKQTSSHKRKNKIEAKGYP